MPTAAWSWRRRTTRPVTTRLVRTEAIRGRVVHADGTPAAGIRLQAYGSGRKHDNGRGEARTGADGRYEMMVSPDEAYAVYVEDGDCAAKSRLDVVVRRGKPADGVDFTLTRGTLLRGTVSVGDGNKPASASVHPAGRERRAWPRGVPRGRRHVRSTRFAASSASRPTRPAITRSASAPALTP